MSFQKLYDFSYFRLITVSKLQENNESFSPMYHAAILQLKSLALFNKNVPYWIGECLLSKDNLRVVCFISFYHFKYFRLVKVIDFRQDEIVSWVTRVCHKNDFYYQLRIGIKYKLVDFWKFSILSCFHWFLMFSISHNFVIFELIIKSVMIAKSILDPSDTMELLIVQHKIYITYWNKIFHKHYFKYRLRLFYLMISDWWIWNYLVSAKLMQVVLLLW